MLILPSEKGAAPVAASFLVVWDLKAIFFPVLQYLQVPSYAVCCEKGGHDAAKSCIFISSFLNFPIFIVLLSFPSGSPISLPSFDSKTTSNSDSAFSPATSD